MAKQAEHSGSAAPRRWAANRMGVDYRAEAARLGLPPRPIIDVHTHVNGARAAEIYREVMDVYGVERTYSQTQIAQAPDVVRALGDRVRFIAIPEYMQPDGGRAFREGFLENLDRWHDEFGARCVKLWNAPRWRDLARSFPDPDSMLELDSPWRIKIAERAVELGMMFMTHIADPDTWFATKYADASLYLEKREHYAPLERMLDRFPVPWIAAHMGGTPEDLGFLTGLMERHDNLLLDTSATKWMVRELSKHPRDELLMFLERFRGRVLFGSDIVTLEDHLTPSDPAEKRFGAQLAESEEDAFELYAGRYWALRTMWETGYKGESNIADPDLMMIDPDHCDEMSAPALTGRSLPPELLDMLYRGASEATIESWYDTGTIRRGLDAAAGPG